MYHILKKIHLCNFGPINTIMIKILAISGSIRSNSLHHAILKRIGEWIPGSIEYEIFSDLDSIPHFNPDLDSDSPPLSIVNFRKKMKESDGIIICTPEYAFGVPGTLKNALDWTVSSGEFANKHVALITASSVGDKGHASMINTLHAVSAIFSTDETLLIPFIKAKVNASGFFTDSNAEKSVEKLISNFLGKINEL